MMTSLTLQCQCDVEQNTIKDVKTATMGNILLGGTSLGFAWEVTLLPQGGTLYNQCGTLLILH